MRFSRRTVLIALVALVAIGGLVSTGALSTVSGGDDKAGINSPGFCKTDGVSLLLDYGTGGQQDIFCAESFQGTGWELFTATSQVVEGTTEYPVGFVCRINDFPSAEEQSCSSTPSGAEGSWAYYYATAQLGDTWMFSASGASGRKPACGDMDAWVFIGPGEKNHEPVQKPNTFKCVN